MAGDFNEVMNQANKSGAPPRAASTMAKFRRTMSVCGFMDMGFVCSKYTWSNHYTKEHLDRGFQTTQWRRRFPFSRVITLSPSESDHGHLLIEVNGEKRKNSRRCKRFHFEEIWHGREECAKSFSKSGLNLQLRVEMRTIQEKLNDVMRQPFSSQQSEEQRLLHVKCKCDCYAANIVCNTMQSHTRLNESLLRPYTDEEIKATFFQMHPSKSPGPDGMSPLFYQKYWDVVSQDVCMVVRCLLGTRDIWAESNYTYLCLIPKIKDPKDATHFRPIALCNVICRIRSKVVANRLKVCLPDIISPLQSAYVPCRNILNVYEQASGQKVSFQRSSIIFSNNVPQEKQFHLASILEVKCVKEHDKYLGLPLRVGKSKTEIFAYLKEKLSKKLISWKSKILSSVGKEILIKAVAQTMPLYAMNCYLLPKGLCDDIHQLCASFFWGNTEEKKKIHWRS
ncbi:uncharacterized protein LOC133723027 [Rosa rugosa]|uniref:uncharacterized protein LOC133723027 n=1 Tax=Rosa rugosa TaxID=74645 RepID=UPI002B418164|nr:uncharacterized protein LOC133723027 [Rosa rugosa]